MLVVITKEMYHAAKKHLSAEPFGIREGRYSYRDEDNVDLSPFSAKDCEKLATILEELGEMRGAKVVARDVRSWAAALKSGGSDTKLRRVRQMVSVFRLFFQSNGRRHLYQKDDAGGMESALLGYYIVEAKYHPKRDRSDAPECVTVHLAYERFGTIRTWSVSYGYGEIIGKTVPEILANSGFLIETDELREAYLHDADRYAALRERIGHQMLCRGSASDDDIDGNSASDSWWRASNNVDMSHGGDATRCIVDVFREGETENNRHGDSRVSADYWSKKFVIGDDGEAEWSEETEDEGGKEEIPDVPVHPFLAMFDLKRHLRLAVHVANCETYVYDTKIRSKLVIPADHAEVIDTLLSDKHSAFVDVIKNKAGGLIVLCQGPPGMGKTLSAEVYAESLKKPLYSIQCSQLGIDAKSVESALMKTLARGKRWNAITLLDEADVYIHKRGNDLEQNAIVGVFLRVLEYHAGILFLTTNREDTVDDAILSRCTVRLEFRKPEPEAQHRIWKNLVAENGLTVSDKTLAAIVAAHSFSGRDIKNILKLCAMVARERKCEITETLVAEMKRFKPTL